MPLESQSSKLENYSSHHPAVIPGFIRGSGFFCLLCMVLITFPAMAVETEYESDIIQAAHAGDAESQFALALLYEYGGTVVTRDPEQSVVWLEKAGHKAVAGACLYLGLKYEYGNTVKQDYSKAGCWYTCAAQQDWPIAQFFLAGLYEHGKGVSLSNLISLAWLGLSAEHGYPRAEEEFARLQEATGFKDMVQLKEKQNALMQGKRTPCN
jgi:TPR repeat protein